MILRIFQKNRELFDYNPQKDLQFLEDLTGKTESPGVREGLLRLRRRLHKTVQSVAKRDRLSIKDWADIWGLRGEIEALITLQKRCAAEIIAIDCQPPESDNDYDFLCSKNQLSYLVPAYSPIWPVDHQKLFDKIRHDIKVTRELFRQDTYVAPMVNVFWWTEEPETDKAVVNWITEVIEPAAHRFLELGQKESFISEILFAIFLLREDIGLTHSFYPMKVARYPVPKEGQLYADLVNDWINMTIHLPNIRPFRP